MSAIAPIVESTGEIVEPSGGDLTMEYLFTYARAKARADLLLLEREDRIAKLAKTDRRLAAIDREIAEAHLITTVVEDQLASTFDDELRRRLAAPITLDAGPVRITWGKPATRWVQDIKPEVIAKQDPELARRLGVHQETSKPPVPKITLRLQEIPR